MDAGGRRIHETHKVAAHDPSDGCWVWNLEALLCRNKDQDQSRSSLILLQGRMEVTTVSDRHLTIHICFSSNRYVTFPSIFFKLNFKGPTRGRPAWPCSSYIKRKYLRVSPSGFFLFHPSCIVMCIMVDAEWCFSRCGFFTLGRSFLASTYATLADRRFNLRALWRPMADIRRMIPDQAFLGLHLVSKYL